jgi:hypothetical protein
MLLVVQNITLCTEEAFGPSVIEFLDLLLQIMRARKTIIRKKILEKY